MNQAGHASGQCCTRIGHAESHRVAQAYLDRGLRFLHQGKELLREWQAESVDVGPGNVFEMAARRDPGVQRRFHDSQVLIQNPRPCGLQLQKDVVVGNRGENARLFQAEVFHNGEVLGVRADPAGDLGKLMSKGQAGIQRLRVSARVEKELALPDDPLRSAQPVQEMEDSGNLIRCVGRTSLLAVAEGGVRYPDFLCWIGTYVGAVEEYARDLRVGKLLPEKLWLLYVVQRKALPHCERGEFRLHLV